jgi:GR25 family glycosyltransferase involved in LPS biosynthesis
MLFDYFDGGFYLNLDKRIERREAFERRSKEAGFQVERFTAIQLKEEDVPNLHNNTNWHIKMSCTFSHFEMIKEAKIRSWKNCLIFEDDCVFGEEFIDKVKICINELKNIHWDIFYMGGEPNGVCESVSVNLAKCTAGMYGTHAYAINESFYDRIINTPNMNQVIDSLYINEKNRTYIVAKELLVHQDDDFVSDLWGSKFKREELYRETYKKWIQL